MEHSKRVTDVYKFEGDLGQGSFAIVKRASNRTTGQKVAIKIIKKYELTDEDKMALQNEIDILTHVDHPNIVKLYGFFDDLLHFYTLMECALDGHLSEALKKRPPFSESDAATLMSQVCQVISHLHSESVIHRDLKP